MEIGYIREETIPHNFIEKFILLIKRIFIIIKFYESDRKLFICLPVLMQTKLSKHKIEKLSKKLINKLKNKKIRNIVLSNCLTLQKELKYKLQSANINILEGRLLYKSLIYEIIEYIFKIKNKKMQERRNNSFN